MVDDYACIERYIYCTAIKSLLYMFSSISSCKQRRHLFNIMHNDRRRHTAEMQGQRLPSAARLLAHTGTIIADIQAA
jgi:hypothetical protein